MEDGDGLAGHKGLNVLLILERVVFVGEEVLPINEDLIGNERIVLIIRNLEIPEKFKILERREPLIFVQFYDDLFNHVVLYIKR